MTDENAKLRELLWRMREEADEAWRNVDPHSVLQSRARRDLQLLADVEELLGPTAWDALTPTTHIVWGDQAICHWTLHAPSRWPPTQRAVKITELIVELPDPDDDTHVEFVARPQADWSGVDCDGCRIRLPTLLREMSVFLDDVQEGIMEGFRAHPETIRAQEIYAREIEPKLTTEQRQRYAEQVQEIAARQARRRARRAKGRS